MIQIHTSHFSHQILSETVATYCHPMLRTSIISFTLSFVCILLVPASVFLAGEAPPATSTNSAADDTSKSCETGPSSSKQEDTTTKSAFVKRKMLGEGKNEWPDLVGKQGEEAKEVILKSSPKLNVQIIPDGSMVTMDYRLDRVRIFVSDDGKVVQIPKKG